MKSGHSSIMNVLKILYNSDRNDEYNITYITMHGELLT